MKENELMMSDVPWAVAWYGNHQCVWLTLNAKEDFFAVNDNLKPVQALYLTPETMDGKFVSDWCAPANTVGAASSSRGCCKNKFRRISRSATRRPVSCPNACF